jgi:tetratricopeptide (TPR) repeat protein
MRAAVTGALVLLSCIAGASAAAADGAAMRPEPATLSEWARGARLFEGLGSFHRTITTGSPAAQRYFDQGMRLVWAFNHDEAARSFAEAARLDPGCAACYWGVALSVGPNYNFQEMDAVRARVAAEALRRAQQNAAHASPIEQELIVALASRYPDGQPLTAANVAPALVAYAGAMAGVARRFPDDADVETLCAEAEMNTHAWALWDTDGRPAPGVPETRARLEAVLAQQPLHPGANHYYIHLMEASAHPEAALASAERLRGMMPGAGHLEHMPAHIFQRVGRYEDAAEANRRAIAADRAYLAATTPPGYYAMYLAHNYKFLAYAAAMEGRKAETLAAVQSLLQAVPLDMARAMGDSGWGYSQQYAALVRFGLWDEMIALGAPDAQAKGLRIGYLYGRAVALAARGRLEEALSVHDELRAAGAALAANEGFLLDIVRVAEPIVGARIAATERNNEEALRQLRKAVREEDHLRYDEPAAWFFPSRQLLGAQLMSAGQAAEAERVYREDLRRNPANGWSLYGLAQSLAAQGRSAEAAETRAAFTSAWQHADVQAEGSAFWIAGADTSRCECERREAQQKKPQQASGQR